MSVTTSDHDLGGRRPGGFESLVGALLVLHGRVATRPAPPPGDVPALMRSAVVVGVLSTYGRALCGLRAAKSDPIRDVARAVWQSRGRRFDPVQLHHPTQAT